MNLKEDTKNQLINKSKSSYKGNQRFKRRNNSKVANTVNAFNKIDMNKLFKEDILTVIVPVHGETDDYEVMISFGGFLEYLQQLLKNKDEFSYGDIVKACARGFNQDDVYINCTCPDFRYRYNYFATKNNINSGAPETRPSNITNPHDTLGSGCKHSLLVLNNSGWLMKVASTINSYIRYMEKAYPQAYQEVIYPAMFGKEWEEEIQQTMDARNDLQTDADTISGAQRYNKGRTQFQKGNTSGFRFAPTNKDDKQTTMESNPDDEF